VDDDWFAHHQQLLGALKLTAFVLAPALLRLVAAPRTPEQYDALPRWLAKALKLCGALFPDVRGTVDVLRTPSLPADAYRQRRGMPPAPPDPDDTIPPTGHAPVT